METTLLVFPRDGSYHVMPLFYSLGGRDRYGSGGGGGGGRYGGGGGGYGDRSGGGGYNRDRGDKDSDSSKDRVRHLIIRRFIFQ